MPLKEWGKKRDRMKDFAGCLLARASREQMRLVSKHGVPKRLFSVSLYKPQYGVMQCVRREHNALKGCHKLHANPVAR